MTLFLPELSIIFHYGTCLYDSVTCDFTLIPNYGSKNRKKKKEKEKKRREKQIK